MRTVYTISKLALVALALNFYTGCGGSSDPASTTTTVNHNFLFFNSCVAPCPAYQLFKHSLNTGATTVVGDGIIAEVEAEYDNDRVNITHNGKYYFSADDGTNGAELWVYDPQANEQAGVNPKMIMDINPGTDGSYPYSFTSLNDKIYFQADTQAEGQELWVYDPVTAISSSNPKMVFDALTGAGNSDPENITALNGKLYFSATQGALGKELYVYDPAVAASATNPQIVTDIRPGTSHSHPRQFITVNGKLYFSADNGTHGAEPWVYDPAVAISGTNPALFYDVNAGSSSSNMYYPISLGDKIYYRGYTAATGNELFVLDTTAAASATNPQVVYDIRSGSTGSNPYYMAAHKGKIYFRAASPLDGTELYAYDPNVAASATNPSLLDINTGAIGSEPHHLVSLEDKLYFGVEAGPTIALGAYDDSAPFTPGINPIASGASDYVDWLYDMIPLTYTTTVTAE